jgi:hypothetical protein
MRNLMIVFCAALLFGGLLFSPQARGGEMAPVSIQISDVKTLAEDGWGPAGKDGERAFRAALKGKAAWLRVAPWWGDGVRPADGQRYIIEVSFKDVLTQPAVCESFGALGSYLARSELHRFGGANDGQWKTANIPVSWDLIRTPVDASLAELSFSASGDLPIEKLLVREARLPEDQVRWEAETRAWVASAQQEKAAKAIPAIADEKADIPDAWKDKPLAPYVREYYEQIHPNSAPKAKEVGATVFARLSQNENEPAAFAVYAQEDLEGVTYQVSDLTGPAGKLACEIKCLTAEYALEPKDKGLAFFPQRLWPMFPSAIKKSRSGWFLINIKTLGDASLPGQYTGKITIKSGAHSAELPVKVEVLPVKLLTMDEAGLRMGGCLSGYVSVGEMRAMLDHNHNMVNIWYSGVFPKASVKDGKLELDFRYMDEWMAQAKACGQKTVVWFLGGNPNAYPESLTIERELYVTQGGKKDDFFQKMAAPDQRGKILAEIAPLYTQWVRQIYAHAKEKGWPELILTPFDEPVKWCNPDPKAESGRKFAIGCGPWIRDHFKAGCKLIHDATPDAKVYISMHHNFTRKVHGTDGRVGEIFIPDADFVCTNAIAEDSELGDKTRKAGKNFWQYGGSASRRYGFGFYFAAWDSRGSLCWAYNWGKRFDISGGGSWEYAWQSPFETIVTPTYEEIREGWDDRRYVETAKALAKKTGKDITPLLAQIRKETLENRGRGGRDMVNDFWEEGRNANKMDQWRKMLADKIIELSK